MICENRATPFILGGQYSESNSFQPKLFLFFFCKDSQTKFQSTLRRRTFEVFSQVCFVFLLLWIKKKKTTNCSEIGFKIIFAFYPFKKKKKQTNCPEVGSKFIFAFYPFFSPFFEQFNTMCACTFPDQAATSPHRTDKSQVCNLCCPPPPPLTHSTLGAL